MILSKDGNNVKKSKHFIIKTDYIKQEQAIGNVIIQHIEGIDNHSDLCTKDLTGHTLRYHTSAMLGHFLLQDQIQDLHDHISLLETLSSESLNTPDDTA